ncbi:MAG: flagellar hook-associated protein FlgK [Planctomycetota bacterium]|nr:flagellar hook-associated protein FlgK [Planctomycetota bacterium]MDA1214080.1 flagellar hook-associated protein FlgK [Planctomycetota bacterium]
MSLSGTLAAVGRSLEIFSTGIQVAGQNISNSSTPGYIREKLDISTGLPYASGSLILGTGAKANGIKQQIDLYLETRIHSANSEVSASSAITNIYRQLESELNALGDGSLSDLVSGFLSTLHDVVNQPASAAIRQFAVQDGQTLAGQFQSLRSRIDDIRATQTINVNSLVNEANRLIDQVYKLNFDIQRAELGGLIESDAGALRSQRYDALTRLSEIIPIQFEERANGSVDVRTPSDYLILAGSFQHLATSTEVDRGVNVTYVRLDHTGTDVSHLGGELKGIVEGRDDVLGGFVDNLDEYVSNFIYEFNKIHASGQGIKRFDNVTGTYAATDATAALNQAGLTFSPEHGSFEFTVANQQTGIAESSIISIDLDGIGTDTSLAGLRDALNAANPHITASITSDNRLKIIAANGYEFSFANDSSGVLASLGINTFFMGKNSTDVGVNSVIANDHRYLATSRGGGESDGSNAQRLTDFIKQPVSGLGNVSLSEYYDSLVSNIAQMSATSTTLTNGLQAYQDSLNSQREQFSGVSLDEEALMMMQFQRSYQASARLIGVIDELFDVLLNI